MTAVIRFADASLRRVDHDQQLHEVLVDRVAAGLDDEHVRAANRLLVAAVRLAVRERLQLRSRRARRRAARRSAARASGFDRPEKTMSRFCGVSASARPIVSSALRSRSARAPEASAQSFRFPPRPSLFTCFARAIASAPGGTSSVITEPAAIHASSPIDTGATNVLSTPVLTLLPIVVRCLDARVLLVRRDVPGGDVRVGADVGVSEVGEMGNLRALSDVRVLELDERAGLGARVENGAGAQVAERTDERILADRRRRRRRRAGRPRRVLRSATHLGSP